MRAVREGRAGVAEHEAAVASSGSPEGGLSPDAGAPHDDVVGMDGRGRGRAPLDGGADTRRGLSPGETSRDSGGAP
jgi:hypothetical protein